MPLTSDTRIIDALRATILEVEQTSGLSADDPGLISLKSILLRRIADLEAERMTAETANRSASPDLPDPAVLPPPPLPE